MAGCFLVDMKYRDKHQQKAISLGTELALIKGNHGLAIWSTINNMATNTFSETIYAVRLSGDGRGWWKIEEGYSWFSYGQNASKEYEHLEIYFDSEKIGELKMSTVGGAACFVGISTQTCDLFTKTPPTKTFKYSGSFRSDDKQNERIFTKLKVKDQNTDPDFWGQENIFSSTPSRPRGFLLELTYSYDGSKWKKVVDSQMAQSSQLPKTLEAWFKPFTEAKGKWTQWHKSTVPSK